MEAPIDEVWALLQDLPRLAQLVPAVTKVDELTQDKYAGELVIKVGPIRSEFVGEATVVERVPPERIVAELQGEDRTSRTTVRADFTGQLFAEDGGTRLEYVVDIALRGRLAQFGNAAISITAKKMSAEFARALQEELSK